MAQSKKPKTKSNAAKHTLNPAGGMEPHKSSSGGAPGNEQDVKRRLGNFDGAGEHARTDDRGSNRGSE